MQYNKIMVHDVKYRFTMWNNSRISYDTKKVKIKMEAIMNKVLEEIKKIGIVPVVVLDDAKDAEPLAKALADFLVQRLHSVPKQQKSRFTSFLKNIRKCLLVQEQF